MSEINETASPSVSSAPYNAYATARARNYALGLLTVVYAFNFIDRQLLAIHPTTKIGRASW